ncbi:MAG: outer membrane protein assembly factor BamE [Saprospiraceae bacterium]|nr:outer membrane protein assembly factor BamE [Saprospiraceae bacterium]
MSKDKSIRLGYGLTGIKFGMTKEELQEAMGAPSEKDSFTNEDDSTITEAWHYDEVSLSFTFDEADDFRLGGISVNNDEYRLRDVIAVGMKKEKVLDALDDLNFGPYGVEDMSNEENPSHELVALDHKSLYLWFDDDHLSEIQWFPAFDDNEEVIWPD